MIPTNSLVIFKGRPARVVDHLEKKVTIETIDEKTIKLPSKNLFLLHAGDFHSFDQLTPIDVSEQDVYEAWELVQGEQITIDDLTMLIFNELTPKTAYATWQWVDDGLYFHIESAESICVHTEQVVTSIRQKRQEQAAKAQALQDFLTRLQENTYAPEDSPFLQEIAQFVDGGVNSCRFLKHLAYRETPQQAHELLLRIGYWDEWVNPALQRYDVPADAPALPVPSLPVESRQDLTHLTSFAIDDAGNQDPDDAISYDAKTGRFWVHVADPAAVVKPDDAIDLAARSRGVNYYLPEKHVPMMPEAMTSMFGLGLSEISPALSIGFFVAPTGQISDVTVVLSQVKVQRISYDEALTKLESDPTLQAFCQAAKGFTQWRLDNGAVELSFPDIKIGLKNKQVTLTHLPDSESRRLVRDAMVMAGVAVAQFAQMHDIPMPYATQQPHDFDPAECQPQTFAAMFQLRRSLKKGQYKSQPDWHGGMGLSAYIQATSPLRRYLDLVVHQQLHAYLMGQALLDSEAILYRVGSVEPAVKNARQAEAESKAHWKSVYLMQNPGWTGQGIIVDTTGPNNRVLVYVPELDLTKKLVLKQQVELGDQITLMCDRVDLPAREAFFKVLSTSDDE